MVYAIVVGGAMMQLIGAISRTFEEANIYMMIVMEVATSIVMVITIMMIVVINTVRITGIICTISSVMNVIMLLPMSINPCTTVC